MQASIQPVFTWSQERIFAGGARNIALLVEWKGITQNEPQRKQSRKVVAREIELRIWLESHVRLSGCHGCEIEAGEGRSLLLKLGKIHAGQRKFIGFEFILSPMAVGKHDALWLQWQYKQPSVERIRELPVQKLGLEYTRHTDVLTVSHSFHVEKHLELLKTAKVLEEVMVLQSTGRQTCAYDKLRTQADQLLLLATRSGDMQLLKEAETLYKQLDSVHKAHSKAAGENEV
ncbi:hypothetical protein [Paenibacillus donghaensis]|uniref:Uncharacterized protein n=1 Tax=Paenibacillus donghaensis TaxID=414771 RepID=A0A2Z2KZ11_9BACL|nr:hypothetical protein [Paenibacillus donghaensis]ASA26038.1 hypothetical protein B9T62_38225 [Paenibacillus donghaensis]